MNISIQTIKKLLLKELSSHYDSACQNCYHDVQRAFIHNGYRMINTRLKNAQTESDIQDILDDMNYRMDIQEWVNSL